MDEEFRDIPISNVEIIFSVVTQSDGKRAYSTGLQFSRPGPLKVYGIWALHHGAPVGVLNFLEEAPPPLPDCFQVLIATDEGAMWGRRCPHCSGYWRTGTPSLMQRTVCSYCGKHSEAHECLSDAQRFYVEACCLLFRTVLDKKEDGRFTIMARKLLQGIELIDGDEPPPEFFVEKAKQTKFNCAACGNRNDILGRYGYCSSCGSRNDATMFEEDIRAVRDSLNAGSQVASALKDAVDAFDTIGRNYANQLCCHVLMTSQRRVKWERTNFAQFNDVARGLKRDFDIDILKGVDEADAAWVNLMFHRRHLYAHKGGIADQKYLDESGDTTVQLGQLIRETQENVHRLASSLVKIARNLHEGFHSIIPTHAEPIRYHREALARRRQNQ
jgi:hypothetical protein